ncbi:hypothetical protein P8452_09770 [Trifolium repens]|nr:hypothetical protein P8452_09770 [Trifolium repens]
MLIANNNKIQATIPCHLVRRFANSFKENYVYVIYYFHVVNFLDCSLLGNNSNRIVFCLKTEISPSQSITVDPYGLCLLSANEVLARKYAPGFLVDAIGVLGALQFDFVEFPPQNIVPVVKFELADQSGRFACAMAGTYVNQFREFLFRSTDPVVIIQFGKSSYHEGFVCIESVDGLTRLMFNHVIPEVSKFKIGLSNDGVYGNSNDNAQLSCVNGIKNNAVIETQSQSHITSEINSSGLKSQSNLGRN